MASKQVGTAAAYLAVYVVAVVLGLVSVQEGTGLAYFWPAAGIGALWLLRGRTRGEVVLDAVLLLVATTVVDTLLAPSAGAALLFGLANLTVALTIRVASARFEGLPFDGPMPRRVSTKRDLACLGAASATAALTSAPFGLAAAYVSTGSLAWETLAAWIVRNTCSTFVVVACVLALLTTLYRAHARRGWAARLTSEPRAHWRSELVVVLVVSLVAAVLLFASPEQVPIAFVMMISAIWIGYRFSPAVGGGYAIVLATLAVLFTQVARGPFGAIDDPTARAIIAQIYALVTAVIVLLLSLGVSERAALVARVRDSETRATSRAELLDAVMNSITDGLVVFESTGRVMMSNPAAEAFGGTRHAARRMGSVEEHGLFLPDGTPAVADALPHVRALRGEVVPAEDLLRIDPDTGEQSTLSVSAVPLSRSVAGEGSLAVLVIHDVTKERTHRRELQAFAGTVAHDLKAPLTGVGSWAEILGDQLDAMGVDVTAPRSSLRRIESSAERMEQLISDLLAYSQAQSATLTPTSLSLTGMVEDVARELREVGTGRPPLIEYRPLGRVLADRMLVSQLLANVIGNAVKYVAPGTRPHVLISSRVVDDLLEVRVADNGIGIPRSERGRIFDSFYRASSSGSYPGTGLGLAICARAVERHGGRISAREGLDGGGTTLVFTLPADLHPTDAQLDEDQRARLTTSADPPPRRTGSETTVS